MTSASATSFDEPGQILDRINQTAWQDDSRCPARSGFEYELGLANVSAAGLRKKAQYAFCRRPFFGRDYTVGSYTISADSV